MLRADPANIDPVLNNRITDAIARHRKWLFLLVALLYVAGFNGKWRLGLDSANYRGLALSVASGHGYVFGNWATHQAYPGLPYALAGIEYLFGPADRTPSLAEENRLLGPSAATTASLLMILACALLILILTYKLLRIYYPTWVAVTITCGVGSNAVFLQYANEFMTDTPFLLGVMMTLYGWELLKRAEVGNARGKAIALMLGGAVIAGTTRPMFWVLLVCWVAVCTLGLIRGPRKFHAICLGIVLAVGITVLAIVPRGYEREAAGWIKVAIERLPKSIHAILNDQLPAAVFGEQLALFSIGHTSPTSVLGSILLLLTPLLLLRRHLLWALMVWCTVGVTLFLTAEPRYYMMVLPALMLGWLLFFAKLASKLPRLAGEVVLVLALSLVTLNNFSKSIRFFAEQHNVKGMRSMKYKGGEYAALLEMAEKIRQHVPPGKRVLGPSGSILSVLTGRHVISQREIIPRGGDIKTPLAMRDAKIDYIVLPGKIYQSKEPVIYRLIQRRVIGAAGRIIAKTATMQLAMFRVTVPPGDRDWRKLSIYRKPTTRPARPVRPAIAPTTTPGKRRIPAAQKAEIMQRRAKAATRPASG